ncbi:MAG: 3,4-dihydroxy-2-butanone-4-phosphate synthase, partial [Spirochaetales bacterium]|nr:3,4-dihydroxy-2-butanone-4-phosphate synthase [Spirochaetales bacterium]
MVENNLRASVEEALEIIADGGMIILTDNEDRENEGDLVMASEKVTPESINFMITEGRGLVCCTLTDSAARRMGLEKLRQRGKAEHHTNFLLPVDAADKVSTGISAFDRAITVGVLSNPESGSADLISPGHLFPLEAVPGGVLERQGHTEASVELCRLSGLSETGLICEIINKDGTMSRKADLLDFARKHDLKILTIKDIVRFILSRKGVKRVNSTNLPTRYGNFRMHLYKSLSGAEGALPFALTLGEFSQNEPVLVRVHSECLTGDLLGSL